MNEIINQFQVYLKNKPLCQLTIRGYVFDATQFMEWLEANRISLSLVTSENASQYLNHLAASCHEIRPGVIGKYSSRTIMKKITSVRSFFYYLQAGND